MHLISKEKASVPRFEDVRSRTQIPDEGPILISLQQWFDHLDTLSARRDPLGIRLRSSEHPEAIADDLDHFALIALELPAQSGPAGALARLLRERWGYRGELRATGCIRTTEMALLRQAGFNAIEPEDAAEDSRRRSA